jgi:hypothetical protein
MLIFASSTEKKWVGKKRVCNKLLNLNFIKMKKKNFISKEEVKNLVENCDFYGYYYGIDIPMQFYTKDTESGKYILHSDTAEFQDFIEKVKEEVFHQNKVKGAEQKEDIIYLGYEVKDGRLVLPFTSFNEYLEDDFSVYGKKITHTFEVKIPILLNREGHDKVMEWIRKMTKTIYKKYISNNCRTDVDWKLLSNGNVQFEVVQSQFK